MAASVEFLFLGGPFFPARSRFAMVTVAHVGPSLAYLRPGSLSFARTLDAYRHAAATGQAPPGCSPDLPANRENSS